MCRRLLQSLLVSLILTVSSFAQDRAPVLLFSSSDTGSPAPPTLAAEKGVKRIRPILLNSRALDPTAPISVEAFSNVTLNVQWNKAFQADKNGTVILSGTVAGAPFGMATLVVNGSIATGSITRGDGFVYQIRTAPDGTQWVLEIDQSQLPFRDDPVQPPKLPAGVVRMQTAEPASDEGDVIDVLVLYTAAARIAAGGTTQMHQLVTLAVAETNLAYTNSNVTHRIRLAHVGEINYLESGDSGVDLTRLRTKGDGFLDEAHAYRDQYQADLVSLWVESTTDGVAGRAYLVDPSAPREDFAFSMVMHSYATGLYVFGHELGHNLGAAHAREDDELEGAYPYSYGFKNRTGVWFSTIMAYPCPNNSCPVIPYFSNPSVQYSGSPTGVDENAANSANNVLTFENTHRIIANYRSNVTGSVDRTGPRLTITSHNSGDSVASSTAIISGLATDAGYGNNGVLSVTVNGQRATGDTAVGAASANWRFAMTLFPGNNTIEVIARDNNQNTSYATIVLKYVLVRPPNDNFSSSLSMPGDSGTTTGTTIGATPQSGEPEASTVSNSVWWRWQPGTNSPATIDTQGSDFDTILSVYTGSAVNALTLVARNDNDGNFSSSRVAFTPAAGTTYYVAVTGFEGSAGAVVLRWQIDGVDSLGPRITITSHANGQVLNAKSIILRGTATDAGSGGNGVRSVTVNGVRANNDRVSGSLTADWSATVALHPGSNIIGIEAQDDSAKRNSTFTTIAIFSNDQLPPNDIFSNATAITGLSGTASGSSASATSEPGEPGAPAASVWWKWIPPDNSTVALDTLGSSFDTILSVYTGNSVPALTLIAEDDDGGENLTSRVSFLAKSNLIYFIQIRGTGGSKGTVVLHWKSTLVDLRGPSFGITSHIHDQVLTTPTVMLGGNGSDYGTGSNGISSVTINGERTSGDTVSGSGTATWSRAVTLDPGTNVFTIVVRDNSPNQNSTTGTFRLNYVASAEPSIPYSVAERGLQVSLMQHPDDLNTGYARVSLGSGPAPAGLAIFTLRQNGIVVSEATVPASRLLQSGSLYAETAAKTRTGVAMVNPNDQTVVIAFRFIDALTSAPPLIGSLTIEPKSQIAGFLDEAPFNGPAPMIGTFEFDASAPVAAIALRGLTNERSEFLVTTTPVADRSRLFQGEFGSGNREIAHFADGAGWTSQLVLFNPGESEVEGRVQWTGADGNDIAVQLAGPFCPNCAPGSSFEYRLAPGKAIYLRTVDYSPVVRTGRVRIEPDSVGLPSAFLIFAYKRDGVTSTEASVTATEPGYAGRLFAENNLPVATGIAVAGDADGTLITIDLFDELGQPSPYIGFLGVPPNGQVAAFLNEIPGLEDLPQGFRGVARLSGGCCFTTVALRARYNERGDFLVTTTAPVQEDEAPYFGEVLFPHIAVGGGYTTELILFSQSPGQAMQGGLQIRDRSGGIFNAIKAADR